MWNFTVGAVIDVNVHCMMFFHLNAAGGGTEEAVTLDCVPIETTHTYNTG